MGVAVAARSRPTSALPPNPLEDVQLFIGFNCSSVKYFADAKKDMMFFSHNEDRREFFLWVSHSHRRPLIAGRCDGAFHDAHDCMKVRFNKQP